MQLFKLFGISDFLLIRLTIKFNFNEINNIKLSKILQNGVRHLSAQYHKVELNVKA